MPKIMTLSGLMDVPEMKKKCEPDEIMFKGQCKKLPMSTKKSDFDDTEISKFEKEGDYTVICGKHSTNEYCEYFDEKGKLAGLVSRPIGGEIWNVMDKDYALMGSTTSKVSAVQTLKDVALEWDKLFIKKNKYEVSVCNDYEVPIKLDDDTPVFAWAGEHKMFEVACDVIKTYDNYVDAIVHLSAIDIQCEPNPEGLTPIGMRCSAFIYDDISGEVARNISIATQKGIVQEGVVEDVGFTKEKMGKFFK